MGAGFPPDTMQTSVKFRAWYRLKGAGVSAATTSMEVGGAAQREAQGEQGFTARFRESSPMPSGRPGPVLGAGRRVRGEVAQSCLTLCDPLDCSPPGFSAHRIH